MQAVWDWEHEFQSTLPVGGATSELPPGLLHHLHFNPRSPWGERLYGMGLIGSTPKFQSTLPVGGATISKTMQSIQR